MDTEHVVHWLSRKSGVKEALNELPHRGTGQVQAKNVWGRLEK